MYPSDGISWGNHELKDDFFHSSSEGFSVLKYNNLQYGPLGSEKNFPLQKSIVETLYYNDINGVRKFFVELNISEEKLSSSEKMRVGINQAIDPGDSYKLLMQKLLPVIVDED